MHMHARFAHYLRAALFAHSPFLRKADVLRIGALTISGRRWPGEGACVAGCTLLQLATDNGDRLIPAGPCVVELLLQHGATAHGPRNHCWPLELAVEHWYPITKSCPPEKNPAFDPEHPVLGPEDPSFVPEYELPLCYDQNDQLTFARNGYCADGMICRCHAEATANEKVIRLLAAAGSYDNYAESKVLSITKERAERDMHMRCDDARHGCWQWDERRLRDIQILVRGWVQDARSTSPPSAAPPIPSPAELAAAQEAKHVAECAAAYVDRAARAAAAADAAEHPLGFPVWYAECNEWREEPSSTHPLDVQSDSERTQEEREWAHAAATWYAADKERIVAAARRLRV